MITKYKNIFSKGYTENRSKEIFVIDSVSKNNPQAYEIKDLKGETITGSSYEDELLSSILSTSYYSETDSRIRDKGKIDLDLSNTVMLLKNNQNMLQVLIYMIQLLKTILLL